jgi:hypothetical protein
MIKKIIILLFVVFVSRANIFSQELTLQVLAPAAGEAVSTNLNYSQTIGQTAVDMIGSSGFEFTQGFQQPGIKITVNTTPEGNGVDVYPNPATDFINVKLFGDAARNFRIDIINITGTLVKSMTINFITSYFHIQQIGISDLRFGLYFVRVTSEDNLISRTFKIEKM